MSARGRKDAGLENAEGFEPARYMSAFTFYASDRSI